MFTGNSSTQTHGIRVEVRTAYLPEESSPRHEHYVFAYQVRIVNESDFRVKLTHRKWFITDGIGRKRMVEGPGVIGRTPELDPGESHQYISGCDFSIPFGKMEGFYTMVRLEDGSEFRARIPAFNMIAPWHLN